MADEKTTLLESIKSAYKEEIRKELLVNGYTRYTEAGIIAVLTGNKNCTEKIFTKIILKILAKI